MAKKMGLMPSGTKAPLTAIRAYEEFLKLPPGQSPRDLAHILKTKYELVYNTLKEPALRVQIYRWMKDYNWEREMMEHSLASRAERLRVLNNLATEVYNLTMADIENGKIPDRAIAQLRGLMGDINLLVEGGKDSQATVNVELMIAALEKNRPNPIIAVQAPPYELGPKNSECCD